MTKSELIERIVTHQGLLSSKDVELAIKTMLEQMSQCLATGDRIEIRGFGSFSLHYRAPRVGRNPKTGQSVSLDGKFVPHFKPGKELRDRVNEDDEIWNELKEEVSMRNFKRLVIVVLAALVALVVVLFVLENNKPVALAMFGWVAPSLPVAMLVVGAFLVGLVLGPLLGTYIVLRAKRHTRS
jgi:integration host factor subunit beta